MGETRQCPACGETIQAAARMCRFCKTSFDAPPPRRMAPAQPAPKSNTVTIVVILLCVFIGGPCIIGILAALLLPAIARATHNAKAVRCCNNLRQLWTTQANYMVRFGGPAKSYPRETGSNFWITLQTTNPPLLDRTSEAFHCPMAGGHTPGDCDYRGPSSNVNLYPDGDPVGADKIGNHFSGQGGNIIRKSGDCQTCGESDALWRLAATRTSN